MAQILDHILIVNNKEVLVDTSVSHIQSKLKFEETTDRMLIDSSLFSTPSVLGTGVIIPNLDGNDTEINLEMLFQFAHEDPRALRKALE